MSGLEELRDKARRALAEISTVKLVGLGGVGGIVTRHVVPLLVGLEVPLDVVLVDGDDFEPHNAERAIFSRVGNKAEVLREDLLEIVTRSDVSLTARPDFVAPENVDQLLPERVLVLLMVDNHATRKLVADRFARLKNGCLVSGGNDGVGEDSSGYLLHGTCGNVQIHLRRGGADASPPLTAFHPEIAEPADHRPDEAGCDQLRESIPQLLVTNLMAASAMMSALWLHLTDQLPYSELVFDVARGRMQPEAVVPVPEPVKQP